MEAKLWRVVKRKQPKDPSVYSTEVGECIETIKEGLSLIEAQRLKRRLNAERTHGEAWKFYYAAERVET